ncbi:uncharacterized protein LY89DRAFT_485995 [Mollisia scopiformis]|uniref:Uncharacterized protein n=1 Tax=Mollisia scopiformis TaxID=149040 RepID=A0A194XGH7_MOLSC|nr:uncharacterized protein LY89DRAFT_485995 [Mollisia scopiformis]KUJ19239.1 hypothetical protein LY89DRAFT_485995 [Mollisia scopiformis]
MFMYEAQSVAGHDLIPPPQQTPALYSSEQTWGTYDSHTQNLLQILPYALCIMVSASALCIIISRSSTIGSRREGQ